MKLLFKQIYLGSLLLLLCSAHSHAVPVNLTGWLNLYARASDGIGPAEVVNTPIAPSGLSTAEAVDGTASSSGSIDIVVQDSFATFDISVEQFFDLGVASDYIVDFGFEIFEPMLYEITGVYGATATGTRMQFFTTTQLSQIATPQVNYQFESDNVAGFVTAANFAVNGLGEGNLGSASGSPSGVLVPGRYFFSYFQGTRVSNPANQNDLEPTFASANGTVSLRLASVPLPAAAWLFGSALLGLGAVKRKKA